MNDLFLVLGLLSFSNRSACRVVSCRQTCRPTSTSHGHPLVVAAGLVVLGVFCALPDWSKLNLTSEPKRPPFYAEHEFFGPAYHVIVTPPTPSELQSMALADEHSISNPGVFPDGSSVTLLDASLTLPHVIITGSLISLLWLDARNR